MVTVEYEGVVPGDVCGPVSAFADAEIQRAGRLAFFIDAERMKSYDSTFRRQWTEWLGDRRAKLDGVHLLIRSRVVQMGLTIVNPLVGNYLVGHGERSSWERALTDARRGSLSSIEQGIA